MPQVRNDHRGGIYLTTSLDPHADVLVRPRGGVVTLTDEQLEVALSHGGRRHFDDGKLVVVGSKEDPSASPEQAALHRSERLNAELRTEVSGLRDDVRKLTAERADLSRDKAELAARVAELEAEVADLHVTTEPGPSIEDLTIEEIRAALDAEGVEYDGRWGLPRLRALLTGSEV